MFVKNHFFTWTLIDTLANTVPAPGSWSLAVPEERETKYGQLTWTEMRSHLSEPTTSPLVNENASHPLSVLMITAPACPPATASSTRSPDQSAT
ncbi:hypothetical protein HD806DRAFT_530236 [Xylariaceae sp. AK1471]|nr:hypothetical protein HD806DRAFT_530236 [Xylariaceae sp. AK1471]